MKSSKTQKAVPVKQAAPRCYICTRTSKITALVGLAGIFMCGAMVGWFQSNSVRKKNAVQTFMNVVTEQVSTQELAPCQVREKALLERIGDHNHFENSRTYAMLVKIGCPEHVEKYTELAINEKQISDAENALDNRSEDSDIQPNDAACIVIEKNLKRRLNKECQYGGPASECYANNARVYARIAEQGCPEHSEFYKQRALEQIQISDGVSEKGFVSEYQARTVVDAYNALKMKAEAKKYLKKVEKMVEPGVDFIMEIQRIIEEQ